MSKSFETIDEYLADKSNSIQKVQKALTGIENKVFPATHVGKLVHPQAESKFCIFQPGLPRVPGYLCAGSFHSDLKEYSFNSAASSSIPKILKLFMPDGRRIRQHLRTVSADLQKKAQMNAENLIKARQAYTDQAEKSRTCAFTDKWSKQIYFPLGKDRYRIFTVMPNALLVWECTDRINQRSWPENNETKGRKAFIHCSIAHFGGKKPQNISYLTSQYKGTAQKLLCLPPALDQKIRLPKRNFFRQIRFYPSKDPQSYQAFLWRLLEDLYGVLTDPAITARMRKKLARQIQAIIEYAVILPAENIRANAPAGWSKDERYQALPEEQKAWLDPHRQDVTKEEQQARENDNTADTALSDTDWQPVIARDIARFVVRTLERAVKQDPKKQPLNINDGFLDEIAEEAMEALNG